MHILASLVLALLAATAGAQSTSGRHFHRDSRLPATPAASPVAEASARQAGLAPLQKLRSGRPWPRHHFGRLPQAGASSEVQAVDAAHKTPAPAPRRGFWRQRR